MEILEVIFCEGCEKQSLETLLAGKLNTAIRNKK